MRAVVYNDSTLYVIVMLIFGFHTLVYECEESSTDGYDTKITLLSLV